MSMLQKARSRLTREARKKTRSRLRQDNARSSVIGDERYSRAVSRFAALADRVLSDPLRWLGADEQHAPAQSLPGKVAGAVRRGTLGRTHPGSPGWDALPLKRRTAWWTTRISATAGTAAAAPRFAGLVADRLPLQDALGASAAGLAVCATARENGVTDPDAWVPLLGRVVLDRQLSGVDLPDHAAAEAELTEAADDPSEPPSALDKLGDGGQRAVRTLWRLARALLEVQGAFDERPRGGWIPRIVGKVPVVGVAAGWLDERGGIKRAARETQEILDRG